MMNSSYFLSTLPTKGIEHYSKAILCLVLIIIYCPSTLTLAFPPQIVAGQWKGADIRSIPKIKEKEGMERTLTIEICKIINGRCNKTPSPNV